MSYTDTWRGACAARSVTSIRVSSIALLGSVVFFLWLMEGFIRKQEILLFQADGNFFVLMVLDNSRRLSVRNPQAAGSEYLRCGAYQISAGWWGLDILRCLFRSFRFVFCLTSKVSYTVAWRGVCDSTIRDKQSC